MLQLSGQFLELKGQSLPPARRHYRLSTNQAIPASLARNMAFLCHGGPLPLGYAMYLAVEGKIEALEGLPITAARGVLPDSAAYLGDGDILLVDQNSKSYRVVFRNGARSQSVLLTERCNHYCLMCSQPPREREDDWLLQEAEQLVLLLPRETRELGFTGGEPTIYGQRLIDLLQLTDRILPYTSVHLLSNGRRFSDRQFAENYAAIGHHDLMVGIPLYSDAPGRHNYVVQSEGAFDETIAGILNLKRLRQRVEIRVVLSAQTIGRLPHLAEFIGRNLLFVDQVALMGLEITGFTRGNLEKLWIDPYDYRQALEDAVEILAAYRIPVMVYNHQLCVVTPRVREFCVRSISDWKNEYLPQCAGCEQKVECGGFFASQVKYRHSEHIVAQSCK